MSISVALAVSEVKTGGLNALNTDLCLFFFQGLGGIPLISLGSMAPFLETDLAVDFIPSFAKLSLLL